MLLLIKWTPIGHCLKGYVLCVAFQGEPPDRESVEKTLVHLFTVLDDRRKGKRFYGST